MNQAHNEEWKKDKHKAEKERQFKTRLNSLIQQTQIKNT